MTTKILYNGSKWAGEAPDPIEALFCMLERHPLERLFEGTFIQHEPRHYQTGELIYAPGAVSFSGNFHTYSHAFHVVSDEPHFVADLTAAIKANQQRPDFLAQPDEKERKRLAREQWRREQAIRDAETEKRLQAELAALERRKVHA